MFRRDAIEACLDAGEWAEALRLAADLEAYAAPEPLPWATFHVGRARALAASGLAPGTTAVRAPELDRLMSEARRLGVLAALPRLEVARQG
jgi:hypothetical protein